MNAIEFQAVAHDGVLDIPQEHRRVLDGKKVRVVLVDVEPQDSDANETVFSRLRKVKTQGPADLSTNHDAYIVGERATSSKAWNAASNSASVRARPESC